jgi:polar amino acid transport system substrate-binding protein
VVQKDSYGFGFQKGSPLVAPFNEAMQKLLAQGLADEMTVKWMGTDETAKVLIPQDWEGKNGTLRYWVNTGTPPMSYLGPDGTPVGYAIDFVLHVAREMDYKVEITECAFDGLIPALQGGKADLAGRSMSITEERLKKIDFSDPFYRGGSVFVVRKSDVNPVLLTSLSTETV